MNTELQHHGILGMKWGVRRTPQQLARARGKTDSERDIEKKQEMETASKNRRILSDEELKSRVERIKLEKQLKELTAENISPGKKFVSDVLSQSGKKAVTTIATGAMIYATKVALTKKFDAAEAAKYMAPRPKNK